MYIIFLGPPGSGKGTQAQLLAKSLKHPHISSGDLLRKNKNLPAAIAAQIAAGAMLSDKDVLDLVKDRLNQDDAKMGWILDGFPRTKSQAQHLSNMFPNLEIITISLLIPDEKIKERLANRRTCQDCGKIFHLINNKPKHEGICDACNGVLITRPDDTPEVITKRLEVYREKTAPLIDYYQGASKYIEIDCSQGQSPEVVDQMIKQQLNSVC